MTTQAIAENPETEQTGAARFDAIVIGAGPAGLYELYLLRQKGIKVRAIEAAGGVGGVWFWNRYPGARLHSESHSYQYFFDKDLLEQWNWTEMFASQPELELYFNRVADLHDLRGDIEFNTRVVSMTFDETTNDWTVVTDTGKTFTSHVVITTAGMFSAPVYPDIPGRNTFPGEAYHTALWPHEAVSFAGKRVCVFGTGSSGVQIIPEIAKDASRLTVFQRTANWVVPLNNRPITAEEMAEIREGYPDLYEKLRGTPGGFIHSWNTSPTTAYTDEELGALYEEAWSSTGFAKWFGLPYDINIDLEVNQRLCNYAADKIRRRVNDPKTAELLIPKHPYGGRTVDCESDFFEVFNQDNVELVSTAENPVLEITPTGVTTANGEIEADIIVFATGFEAFVGALNRIDITGVGGKKLKETWEDGPETLLGVQVSGFPNLFIVGGPHGKAGHGNSTRCAEGPLEWVSDLTETITQAGIKRFEADPTAEKEWTEHVFQVASGSLMAQTKSYFFGDNVPGRKRAYVAYMGTLPDYVERLETAAANGYPGFIMTK